ncbi:hypothetical protein ABLV88_13880 (plasmid) [Staphylococcus equorum]|uniref:hypothetical protein n=1 Tax=Staphylococcus TaxID=1279 RepID=UPI000708A0A3|nr:hypothetical protein [Staphylococcus sp. NAM3COL9]KRG11344.1 hypothetical protein ACA31_00260 [Staphylococcus sp. NAM3COL9]
MKKQIISVLAASVILTPVVSSVQNSTGFNTNTAEAKSSGFKYFTTTTGSTAASDFASKGIVYATAGALGYATGGVSGGTVAGLISGGSGEIASSLKTVYVTDKQYINSVGQIKHNATMYKDKAKKKKIGTVKFITSTTYDGSGPKQ